MQRDQFYSEPYKGFTITQTGGKYRAAAYANPDFYDTNLTKLKTQIRNFLKK